MRTEITPYNRLLRLEDVKERTGLSRSTIYSYISKGLFPQPINMGARRVSWPENMINDWVENKILETYGEQEAG